MKALTAVVFIDLCFGSLVVASGLEGSCAMDACPITGSAMLQIASRKRTHEFEEAEPLPAAGLSEKDWDGAGEGAGQTDESLVQATSEKLRSEWPNCKPWPLSKIDEEINKEKAKLKDTEKNSKKCFDGLKEKIYWLKKRIDYVKRALSVKFGLDERDDKDGDDKGDKKDDKDGDDKGDALVEDSAAKNTEVIAGATGLTDDEVAMARSQGWPKWKDITEKSGKEDIKKTQAEVEKWTKFREEKCGLGPYWAKKKIEYFESCKKGKPSEPSS